MSIRNQKRKPETGVRVHKVNYHGWKQVAVSIVFCEGVIFLLALLCYNNLFWMLPLQLLMLPIHNILERRRQKRRKIQYLHGFREVLQSLMTSLQAGYSMENSSRILLQEMTGLYPSGKNPTVSAVQKIVRGMELHCPVEQMFMEYARETEVEEIYEFAVILNIVRSTGGNVVDILKNSMEHLQCKMDATEELQVSLSGRIFEKNIMLLMPFGVLIYLRLANPDYVETLYSSLPGNILMTVAILATLLCFFWTEKIMAIEF